MKLYKAVRPKGYTGPIRETPKELIREVTAADINGGVLEKSYEEWAACFFVDHPHGRLDPTFGTSMLLVRGTGDNGRWLVAWWIDD